MHPKRPWYLCTVVIRIGIALSLTSALSASAQNPVELALVPWANGIGQIVDVAHCGDDRVFAVSQWGAIFIVRDSMDVASQSFLNISPQVVNDGERGMLGLAFDIDYAENGHFYVQYMHTGGQFGSSTVSRFTVSATDPNVADPASEVVLFSRPQPSAIHQGGDLAVAADGTLYISMGDGGGGGDPNNRAQDLTSPFGKILRIRPEADGTYSIPGNNPLATAGGDTLREIFAYGLRNPYRMGLDRATGDLWIGDVGQESYEELNVWPAGANGLPNFGWRCYEGNVPYNLTGCEAVDPVPPVITLPHGALGGLSCAIVGGRVYRGTRFPRLEGRHIYTDFCSGEFHLLRPDGNGGWSDEKGLSTHLTGFSSIGEDADGELYTTHLSQNRLYKVVDRCPMDPPSIVRDGAQLVTDGGVSYQWLFGGDTIPGATDAVWEPTEDGWYTVIANYEGGCALRSDSTLFLITGLATLQVPGLRVYPQPAADRLVLEHPAAEHAPFTVRLLDGMGRLVRQQRWASGASMLQMDVSDLAHGLYGLELRDISGGLMHRAPVSVLR